MRNTPRQRTAAPPLQAFSGLALREKHLERALARLTESYRQKIQSGGRKAVVQDETAPALNLVVANDLKLTDPRLLKTGRLLNRAKRDARPLLTAFDGRGSAVDAADEGCGSRFSTSGRSRD